MFWIIQNWVIGWIDWILSLLITKMNNLRYPYCLTDNIISQRWCRSRERSHTIIQVSTRSLRKCALGPQWLPWWRLPHIHAAKPPRYLPSEQRCPTRPPRVCASARVCVCVLTHDGDVILDQEQSFLAALHQHGQSVGVLLPVERHPVHAEHSVSGPQSSLSAERRKKKDVSRDSSNGSTWGETKVCVWWWMQEERCPFLLWRSWRSSMYRGFRST